MSVNPLDIPEILQWVLSCCQILEPEDLFSTSLVNKTWYQVSKRAQWVRVELDSDSWVAPYHQALAAQLSMYGHFVRTLVLKECVADQSQLEALLPFMTHLQSIIVGRVTLYNRSSSLLQSLELLPSTHLRYLCLPHVSTASGRIDLLLRICESQAHQITHLDLLDSEIDDDVLADVARTCPSLRTLDLSRNEVIAFKGVLHSSSDSDNVDDSLKNSTATTVSGHWVSNQPKSNSPYSQRQVALQHDATFGAYDTLGVLLTESKQQQTQIYHQPQQYQQHQHKQQHQTQHQDHTLPSTSLAQSPPPRPRPSKLLQESPPFMHLEELSLVFCFGIANTEFQTLFRSFRNKSLRSLNLQFTNIEDSGLEALAHNLGHRLTSVCVSYCNRITARGIRALVEPNRCPRLLELEFLSCDLVSTDCFRNPNPGETFFWGCHRLRRLEFTFHPRVAMKRMDIERAAAAAEAEVEEQLLLQQQQQSGQPASMDPPLDVGTNNFGLVLPHAQDQSQQGQAQLQQHHNQQQQQHLEQQQQHQQTSTHLNKQDKQMVSQDCGIRPEESQAREQCRDNLWLDEQESVRNDYYALFRQLKRLTELRYLNIYNSPALNNSIHSSDSSLQDSSSLVALATVDEPESTLPLVGSTPTNLSQEQESESVMEEQEGSSSSDATAVRSSYERRRESIASGSGQGDDDDQATDAERRLSVSDDQSNKVPGVTELSEMREEAFETAISPTPEPKSVHPFSLKMGLKALERLTNLESLTFYERSSVTLGEAEVRWIGKHFPHLSMLQLRGSIDVSEKVSQQLASRRPDIKLQVCSLFE
ncbi:hypothetical protein BG015_006793 [Linnemannia schmuckeri]|uniref:F-box domain-containing protein n=1 Tax=Linnemannia schmuckeri TaxID=64567 RepID=A0A9P5S6Y9_9FUNG|nr:hypothetical protein BG015_006793 [Linnemannia schmuckeri]